MKIRATSLRRASVAMAVAGLLGMSLSACGGDSKDTDATATASARPTQAQESPSPSPKETAENAALDGDLAGFCDAFGAIEKALADLNAVDGPGLDHPDVMLDVAGQYRAAVSDADSVDMPAEIADEWAAFAAGWERMADAMTALAHDKNDAAATRELSEITSDTELNGAAEIIEEYASANCS